MTRARRVATLLAVAAILLGASLLLPPGPPRGRRRFAGLAPQRDEDGFQNIVAESEPLFIRDGEFSVVAAIVRFGPFVFAYPLALLALCLRAPRNPARWLFLFWAAGLFAVTLLQRRFFNTSSVGYALVLGLALCLVARQLAARWSWLPRGAAGAVAAAVALVLLLPMTAPYQRQLRNEWAARQNGKLEVPQGFGAALAGVEAAIWLRGETPPTAGWLDPDSSGPEYGVLAPWHLGHVIEYIGRRPTVVDNFGDDIGRENFAWARRYYLGTEDEMVEELAQRRIRYVIAQPHSRFLEEKASAGTLFYSLYFLDGSRFEPEPGFPEVPTVPALSRHRLVFETLGVRFSEDDALAVYKIFEVVPGAEVVGEAPAGSRVRASITLRTNRKRSVKYEAEAIAGADGLYRLRLPHASAGGPSSIRTRLYYILHCGAQKRRVSVREAAVQAGSRIRGPAMCGTAFPGAFSSLDADSEGSHVSNE